MPGLEDISKVTTPTEDEVENSVEPEQPVVRELTQTDRINRQLLKSFLERINTNGMMESQFQNASEGNNSNGDGFED